jgi:hypothetical protein
VVKRSHLPIVEPCAEDWSTMTGDARRRHCSRCSLEVLHVSAMTAEEARQALARRTGERVCVRYACDGEDNVVFAAPRSGLRAVALATALAGCTASETLVEEPALPEPTEACDDEPAPAVEEVSGQCEGGPGEPEVVEGGVEGGIVGYVEGSVTMGAMVATVVAAPPLVLPARPSMSVPVEPGHPRHVVPLDMWMGAVAPDLIEGALPRRRGEEP